MALIYVEEHEKSLDSEPANGTINEGDLVVREVGGGAHVVDPSADSDVDCIVPHLANADNIAEHEYDYRSGLDSFTFDGDGTVSGSDRVPLAVKEENAVWRPSTIPDDGTNPAPSIERNTTVGVVDLGSGVGIVEAGYTDDGGTQYGDGGAGDFIELGEAEVDENETVSDFDERVRVRISV